MEYTYTSMLQSRDKFSYTYATVHLGVRWDKCMVLGVYTQSEGTERVLFWRRSRARA